MTDYVAIANRFAGDEIIGRMDCVYSSWATDAPQGFEDDDVADLCRLVPFLALAVKSASLARIAGTLVETILAVIRPASYCKAASRGASPSRSKPSCGSATSATTPGSAIRRGRGHYSSAQPLRRCHHLCHSRARRRRSQIDRRRLARHLHGRRSRPRLRCGARRRSRGSPGRSLSKPAPGCQGSSYYRHVSRPSHR